jgi:hypothetical protein
VIETTAVATLRAAVRTILVRVVVVLVVFVVFMFEFPSRPKAVSPVNRPPAGLMMNREFVRTV